MTRPEKDSLGVIDVLDDRYWGVQTQRSLEHFAISTEQLDERVPVPPSGDEIAHLAQTMNRMLTRLQAGHAAPRRFISHATARSFSNCGTASAPM